MIPQNEVVTVLMRALEARDPWTAGHSWRVSTYAKLLAEGLFSRQEAMQVADAALLHDIGKLGVSESVLLKAGSLNEKELLQVREHPERGFEILDRLPSVPHAVALMVLYHHERWDGSGYPRGLKTRKIPLGSQVIALAEAYDYMTSELPYRPGLNPSQARLRVIGAAGKQFHPELAAAFCELPLIAGAMPPVLPLKP